MFPSQKYTESKVFNLYIAEKVRKLYSISYRGANFYATGFENPPPVGAENPYLV